MIFEILQVLTEEVNSYFDGNPVSLENVATLDNEGNEGNGNGPSEILLTLLNLKEEFALKNNSNYQVSGTQVTYRNPKIHLNLFVMFSAHHASYAESLKRLSKIIEFFQGKRIFTQDNTTFDRDLEGMESMKNFRFITELFTPSFEEMNFIWGTLGGKQHPSVIYKVTLVEIERDHVMSQGSVVTGYPSKTNTN